MWKAAYFFALKKTKQWKKSVALAAYWWYIIQTSVGIFWIANKSSCCIIIHFSCLEHTRLYLTIIWDKLCRYGDIRCCSHEARITCLSYPTFFLSECVSFSVYHLTCTMPMIVEMLDVYFNPSYHLLLFTLTYLWLLLTSESRHLALILKANSRRS